MGCRDIKDPDRRAKALIAPGGRSNMGRCEKHLLSLLKDDLHYGVCVLNTWPENVREATIHLLRVMFPVAKIKEYYNADD